MNNIRIAFFQLLQVAIGSREKMSLALTDAEWDSLYATCKQQAVLGLGYAGIMRLPQEQRPRADMQSMWQWVAENISAKNADVNRKCVRVTRRLQKDGFGVCVLKGQANLMYYPEHLRSYRNSGDIDVWLWHHDEKVKDPVSNIIKYSDGEREGCEVLYHHVEMEPIGKTEVEAHFRLGWLSSPFRNRKLDKWTYLHRESVVASLESKSDGTSEVNSFPVAPIGFNVVYQLLHIYRHLYEAGVGIRQLIDYYFVLREYLSANEETQLHGQTSVPSRSSVMETLRELGLDSFAGAVMYVMREALDMPDAMLLCPVDEVRGRILLDEIMTAGNFGCADGGAEIHNNGSHLQKFAHKLKRSWQLGRYYPHEALWLPTFTMWHMVWRRFRLWRY